MTRKFRGSIPKRRDPTIDFTHTHAPNHLKLIMGVGATCNFLSPTGVPLACTPTSLDSGFAPVPLGYMPYNENSKFVCLWNCIKFKVEYRMNRCAICTICRGERIFFKVHRSRSLKYHQGSAFEGVSAKCSQRARVLFFKRRIEIDLNLQRRHQLAATTASACVAKLEMSGIS